LAFQANAFQGFQTEAVAEAVTQPGAPLRRRPFQKPGYYRLLILGEKAIRSIDTEHVEGALVQPATVTIPSVGRQIQQIPLRSLAKGESVAQSTILLVAKAEAYEPRVYASVLKGEQTKTAVISLIVKGQDYNLLRWLKLLELLEDE